MTSASATSWAAPRGTRGPFLNAFPRSPAPTPWWWPSPTARRVLHPRVPVARALFGIAIGRPDRVVDIDVGDLRRAAISGACRVSSVRNRAATASSCRTWPTERPQERADVDGARTPSNSRAICTMPQHPHVRDRIGPRDHARDQRRHLCAGVTPDPPGPATCPLASPIRFARSAKRTTGTRPACDTRFGSSNTATAPEHRDRIASAGCPSLSAQCIRAQGDTIPLVGGRQRPAALDRCACARHGRNHCSRPRRYCCDVLSSGAGGVSSLTLKLPLPRLPLIASVLWASEIVAWAAASLI